MMLPLVLIVVVFVPMLLEARHSAANERRLRAMGAVEPPGDVHAVMRVVYPACFVAMIAEGWIERRGVSLVATAGALVFLAAKILKAWAIVTLGVRWSFRVLVPPGHSSVRTGPYRFTAHPNYIAVAGELGGVALMAQAPVSGVAAIVVFTVLMLLRVRVEERALGLR